MTGTMLQGTVKVGDILEIPTIKTERKVKSIQMFRVGVPKIEQGDRAGLCLTQFDPSLVERGVVCTPGTIPILPAVIAVIDRRGSLHCYKSSILGYDFNLSKMLLDKRIKYFESKRYNDPPNLFMKATGDIEMF